MAWRTFVRRCSLGIAGLLCCLVLVAALNPTVHSWYERRLKDHMEKAEFAITWLESFYFVLPMIFFRALAVWTEVFFDCFTPLSLWLDVAYSAATITFFLVFIGVEGNLGRLLIEFGGLVSQLCAIFAYVMLKMAHNGVQFAGLQAKIQVACVLVFFQIFGLAMLGVISFWKRAAHEGEGYWVLAMWIAIIGMFSQAAQLGFSLFFRARNGNWNDDRVYVAKIKLSSVLIRVITLSYDCWLFASRGYWASPEKRYLVIMTAVSLVINCCMAIARYIGPSRVKGCCDRALEWITNAIHACPEASKHCCCYLVGSIWSCWSCCFSWVRGTRFEDELAAADRRAAARRAAPRREGIPHHSRQS